MAKKPPFHITFLVDGFTLKKVNQFYKDHHPLHSCLDFRGIRNWARTEAIRLFNPPKKYAIMDCHYYHPYKDPNLHGNSTKGIKDFERELHHAGFQIHYLSNPNINGNTPNMGMIDDSLLFACYCRTDAVILLTTQGQFCSLPDKLKAIGIPTLLLGWNFTYSKDSREVKWKTDPTLKEKSTFYIAMEKIANIENTQTLNFNSIFQKKNCA